MPVPTAVKKSAHVPVSSRWVLADWVSFGAETLRSEGPTGLTLERLCATSGRTKGSFYHHFSNVDEFLSRIAGLWLETETHAIADKVTVIAEPRDALRELARLSAALDVRLEIGVRALAVTSSAVRAVVTQGDRFREQLISNLVGSAYGLTEDDALSAARLFHALHIAAQIRSPEDIHGFSASASKLLVQMLDSGCPAATATERKLG